MDAKNVPTAGTPEQLHLLIETVEKVADENRATTERIEKRIEEIEKKGDSSKEYQEVKVALDKQAGNLADVEERLRALDDLLPKGGKLYQPIVPDPSQRSKEARNEVARMILDSVCVARNSKPRFDSAYFRAVTDGQIEETDALGGYLVYPEYRAEIVRIVENYGVARRLLRVFQMNTQEMVIPTNTDGPTVYWDTELTSHLELVAPTASVLNNFARPTLTAHKLIATDTLSIEVVQDALPLIEDFVVDVFAIAIAKEEDNQAFVSAGGGTEPFTGLINTVSLPSVTGSQNTYLACLQDTGATGGYNKLLEVMDGVDESVADTSTWLFSNSILNAIRQVKSTTAEPLWGNMVAGEPGTLLGRPYVRSRIMPKQSDGSQTTKPFLIFGDFRYHAMGDRMQLAVDASPHAAFKEAGIVLRFMERVGFKNLLLAPFCTLKAA